MNKSIRLYLSRLFIGIVLFINVQSAIVFLVNPAKYAPFYELTGPVGNTAVQGFGVLFLMWNIPYIVALIHPVNHRISLYEAVAMQMIGLIGESFIFISTPVEHKILAKSIQKFMIFDGFGLLALLIAGYISRIKK